MDSRMVFNLIPEEFDRWRPRYCAEAFADMAEYAGLCAGKSALEIGPGTGQATEPVLQTGCDYMAIELGAPFTQVMRSKFCAYPNFSIVNADFETHDFGERRFDLVYSAATIQWIPERTAFTRAHELLRPGGTLAMLLTRTDRHALNPELSARIDDAYARFFHPTDPYTCRLNYENAVNYGFSPLERREYVHTRELDARGFVAWTATHADHIRLAEPYRTEFFDAVRDAILEFGDCIRLRDKVVLYLTRRL